MKKKIVSGIMLTLLLIGMLTLAFNIQPIKASGTIHIRADGSIDPPRLEEEREEVDVFPDIIFLSFWFSLAFVLALATGFFLGKTKKVIILASVGILVAPSFLISKGIFWAAGVVGISEGLNIWSILFFSIVNVFNFFWFLGAMCGLVLGSILSEC